MGLLVGFILLLALLCGWASGGLFARILMFPVLALIGAGGGAIFAVSFGMGFDTPHPGFWTLFGVVFAMLTVNLPVTGLRFFGKPPPRKEFRFPVPPIAD